MRWLALDVGSRRVGVAVCDETESVATPLAAIAYSGPEALAAAAEELVRAWGAGGVVVGVPVTRSGAGRGEARVAGVVAALVRRIGVPVETVDERGTTAAANTLLSEAGVPHRRWAELVDSLAARLILDTHLANRRRAASRR